MALPNLPWFEIERSVDQDGEDHKTGIRVFWVIHSAYRSLRSNIFGQRMPLESGSSAPYCWRVKTDFGFYNKHRAKMTCFYRTRRQPGTATLSIITQAANRTVTKDLDGKIIVGPRLDDSPFGHGLNYYKIVRGSNTIHEGRAIIVIKTSFERNAFNASEINRLMLLQGTVNNTDLPNFGNFPKGTLKLLRSPLTNRSDEGLLWYLDLAFEVCPIFPLPWNEWTQTQLFTKIAQQVPKFDKFGDILDTSLTTSELEIDRMWEIQQDTVELAAGTTSPESTKLFKESDFTDIDRLLGVAEE